MRTSKYVGELARIMTHVENEVIARLLCKSDLKLWYGLWCISSHILPLICVLRITAFTSRLLLVFLRHASFVRPLGESGKLQLTKDLAQIEFALGPLIDAVGLKTSDLGMPFQALRAFR